MTLNFSRLNGWAACVVCLVAFAAGSLVTGRLVRGREVRAAGDRLFELRVYHAVPGKLPVMESRFREKTSKILARHNLNVVGYWETADTSLSENSFIFMLAYDSREAAKKNWEAVLSDPEFQEIEKAEQTEKTLVNAEVTFMRPTDFSKLK
jgi:hypothetical protein